MDSQAIYRRRWVILSVLIVGLLAIVIDNTVLNVAMKTIAEPRGGLGASQSQLEWAINSYTLVFAGLLFTFGVIGDKVGRKRMLMIGLALFGIASLLSAYSRSPEQLIFARAAMGLGGAAVMPQTLSIISNVFEPADRRGPQADGAGAFGRHRHRHRPGARRPVARPLLVGFGLPDQRAGDRLRHRRRRDPGAGVAQPRARQDRLRGRAAVHRGPGAPGVRDRPGRRQRVLAAPGRARPDRRRPGRTRGLRVVRGPDPASVA